MGIYVDNMQKMNIATLKASVDELRPVFMYGQTSTGAGHWWIVDGYRTQPTTRASFFFLDLMFTCMQTWGKANRTLATT